MTEQSLKLIEKHACFGGWQQVWQHDSASLACSMRFAVYLPPQASSGKVPVLYWLSGLTCTEQNFITKAAMQQYAAAHGIIVVAPDTSPRGDNVADDSAYDLGQGAGFYVNATQQPWAANYRMYDYVLTELPNLITANFPVTAQKAISGHSMGGHGALMLALRNPNAFTSVSAFAPIVAPSQVPWGQKAFNAYLGADTNNWQQYDAVALINQGHKVPEIFVDQGLADDFYAGQLQTGLLEQACKQMSVPLKLRYHDDYDHSYYFIASFIADHIAYHAARLYGR